MAKLDDPNTISEFLFHAINETLKINIQLLRDSLVNVPENPVYETTYNCGLLKATKSLEIALEERLRRGPFLETDSSGTQTNRFGDN